jgi:hypothetical protein
MRLLRPLVLGLAFPATLASQTIAGAEYAARPD